MAAMEVEPGARRNAGLVLLAALGLFAAAVRPVAAQEEAPGTGGQGGTGNAQPGTAQTGTGQPGTGQPGGNPPAANAGGGGFYAPAPGWIVNLGMTVSETWTDAARTAIDKKVVPLPPPSTVDTIKLTRRFVPDYITQVSPTLSIHGDTPRVSMDLTYSPSVSIYAINGSQSNVSNSLAGHAHAVVMEDAVFVDMTAFAGLMPAFGNYAINGIPAGPGQPPPVTVGNNARETLSQVYSFGITPYAVHRFDGWGTAKVGVTFQASASGTASYTNAVGGTSHQAAANTQNLQGTAQFTSGENLGRLQSQTVVSSNLGTGTGVARNSSDYVAQQTLSYALTRWAAVFGQVGYEAISYSSTDTPFKSNAPTWSAGMSFTFGSDGHVKIGYGRRYGDDSITFEGAYALTAKTSISGRIWTGFGTDLQLLQADLANAGVDQYGGFVDVDTGSPIFLGGFGGGAGGNQNLYRTQNLSVSLNSVVLDDPVSIGVQATKQTLVATAGIATAFPNNSLSVNASWSHAFGDLTTGGLNFVYGIRDLQYPGTGLTGINGKEHYLATSAYLSYTFSPSLTGSARYSYYDQVSNVQFRSYSQNLIMISLSKQF